MRQNKRQEDAAALMRRLDDLIDSHERSRPNGAAPILFHARDVLQKSGQNPQQADLFRVRSALQSASAAKASASPERLQEALTTLDAMIVATAL